MSGKLRSWKVVIRHPYDMYVAGSSGYGDELYPRYETLYIVARNRGSACDQARAMVGRPPADVPGSMMHVRTCTVLTQLE